MTSTHCAAATASGSAPAAWVPTTSNERTPAAQVAEGDRDSVHRHAVERRLIALGPDVLGENTADAGRQRLLPSGKSRHVS